MTEGDSHDCVVELRQWIEVILHRLSPAKSEDDVSKGLVTASLLAHLPPLPNPHTLRLPELSDVMTADETVRFMYQEDLSNAHLYEVWTFERHEYE